MPRRLIGKFKGIGGLSRIVLNCKKNNRYDLIQDMFGNLQKPTPTAPPTTPAFTYSFIPNNGLSISDGDIIDNIPINNFYNSFTITTPIITRDLISGVITVEVPFIYTSIINGADGLSFYTTNQYLWYNSNTTNLTILNFRNIPLTMLGSQFYGLSDLTFTALDAPTIHPLTSLQSCFYNCTNFDSDISNWITTNVINIGSMFSGASNFNKPIGNWDTRNVTTMTETFCFANKFNQYIGNWNTYKVTSFTRMFYYATDFNNGETTNTGANSLNWNVTSCLDFSFMFSGATNFNQPIGSWVLKSDIPDSAVTLRGINMVSMFYNATKFNQNISYNPTLNYWNTYCVKPSGMDTMFIGATQFNNGGTSTDVSNPLGWYLLYNFFSNTRNINPNSFRAGSNLTRENGLSINGTTSIGKDY